MPWERIAAEKLVFGAVDEDLEGAIVVAAVGGVFLAFVRERPDITSEGLAEIFCFEDERILEDLDVVVGDETVAEGGGVEDQGEEDECRKVKPVGAARSGWRRLSGPIGRRWCNELVGRGVWRLFVFSGQGVGCSAWVLIAAAGRF